MPARQRVEIEDLGPRQALGRGRRHLDRRSFLRASVVAIGATVGIGAARWISLDAAALAGEAAANNEKRKKDANPKSLAAARCPVTGDNVSKEFSSNYMGGKLFFCCEECIGKFKADWSTYEAKANAQLVITGQFKQIRCPVTGDEFAPGIKMKICGVDVCFASADCVKKVRRAPADKRAEMVFGKGFDKGFATKNAKIASTSPSAAVSAPEKWSCVVCGYMHKGSSPPGTCPKCGAKSDSFKPVI